MTEPAAPGTDSEHADAPSSSPPPAPTIVFPKAEATKGKKTTTYTFSGLTFSVTEDVDDTHVFPTIVKNGCGCGCGGGCGGAAKSPAAASGGGLDVVGLIQQVMSRIPPDTLARLADLLRMGFAGPSEH